MLGKSGVFFKAKGEVADRSFGSGLDFSQVSIRSEMFLPLSSRVSGLARFHLGWSEGADLPAYYRFSVGGASPYFMLPDHEAPFHGIKVQGRTGEHLQLFGLGAQVRVWRTLYTR